MAPKPQWCGYCQDQPVYVDEFMYPDGTVEPSTYHGTLVNPATLAVRTVELCWRCIHAGEFTEDTEGR